MLEKAKDIQFQKTPTKTTSPRKKDQETDGALGEHERKLDLSERFNAAENARPHRPTPFQIFLRANQEDLKNKLGELGEIKEENLDRSSRLTKRN